MAEYTKENLYTNIAGAGNVFTAGDQTWNQEKIRSYFDEIFTQLNAFKQELGEYKQAVMDFINNDSHKGDEAEAAKTFATDVLSVIADDLETATKTLQGMMQNPAYEGTIPLLEDFCDTFAEDDTAIITKSKLDSVIVDFSAYNRDFGTYAASIKTDRDTANGIITGLGLTTVTKLDEIEPKTTQKSFDDFVEVGGDAGFVPDFLKKFLSFLDTHNDDFSGSAFKGLIENIILCNMMIEDHLGDGAFDPDAYTDMVDKMHLITGKDLSDAEQKEYEDYMKKLAGVTETNVEAYDPVNVNNGNYVSDKTDLVVGVAHPIKLRRFYNAISDRKGILGLGWTFGFEMHVSKDEDTLKVLYADGREGIFMKETVGEKELFTEIHGDRRILEITETGYKLSEQDQSFMEFDQEGYLVSVGDNNGIHTNITYNTIQSSEDEVLKAVPVKVETKEGYFVQFDYDNDGILIRATDHSGRTLSYGYVSDNTGKHLVSIDFPDGTTRKYSYNAEGLLVSSTRQDQVVAIVNDYDNKGRISHQTMPDGGELSFSYDEKNHVTTVIETNGNKVEYISDELGRNVKTRYPDLGIEESFSYNAKNQRITYTDRNGFTTRYTYDNRGHVTGIIGPDGLREFYTYDAEGRLISKKDSEGNVTKFAYDLEGNLYSVVNPLGDKIKFDYEDGRVVSIRDSDNKTTGLTYDERGNIASITDPSGVVTKYECDNLGRVIATEDAEGNRTTYDIDVNDNLRKIVDPEGNVTGYEYNSLGKVSAVINPDGTRKTWEYGVLGKPVAYTDEENRTTRIFYNLSSKEEKIILPNNGTISYEYDLLGNRTKITDPDGRVTDYTYDNAGNVLTFSKGQKSVSSFSYDGRGRVVRETDGNGNVTSYEYDRNGNVTKIIAPNGGETVREYDPAGRLKKEIDALGRETVYTHEKNGNIKTITDPYGVTIENTYDKNRLVKVTKKAGDEEILVESYEYDSVGRLKSETQTDGFVVSYTYTKNGKIASATGSNGRRLSYTYDSCGRVVALDDCGKVTRYTYTPAGKLKCVTDALGHRVEYTYDELDLLCKIERFGDIDSESETKDAFPGINSAGHVTTYEHSLSGKVISITDALGQKDLYTYDVLGNVKSHIDRDGYETSYTRDENGNVTGIDYADGKSVKMKYNALNILEEVKDHLGLTKIETDILGRNIGVTDYKGRTVGYEYGPYDNRKAVVYPDGKRAEYSYDAFGRLISLRDSSATLPITYSYDDSGRLVERSLPNGTMSRMEYYQGGMLKSLVIMDAQGVLDEYAYKYGIDSLLTDVDRSRRDLEAVSGQYHYEYDVLGRLTGSAFNGKAQVSYEYDAFGNRIEMVEDGVRSSYEYDQLDRLIKSTVKRSSGAEQRNIYSYDRRGNQIAVTSDDVIRKTFQYDAMGNMTGAHDSEKGDIQFSYNGLGFRVESSRPEERIEYLCDISREYYNLLERTVNGETETFVYDNNVVSMNKGGSNFYYLHDELGSAMYLTGTDGLTVDTYAYDDFGRRIDPYTGKLQKKTNAKSHAYTKNGNIIQPFAFIGYQEDEVSELNYAQARYYDPQTGRFDEEDKIKGLTEVPDTHNRYVYCLNSPISYGDLNGLFLQVLIGAGIGAIYGVGSELISCAITGEKPNVKDVIAAGVGGAVGGAVTAVAGPVAGAAIGSLVTDGISYTADYVNGDKDLTLKNVALDAGKALVHAGVSAAFAKGLDKLGGKVADKLVGQNVGIAYDAVDQAVKLGKGTIAQAFMTNPLGYLAYEAASGLPGLGFDTIAGSAYKLLGRLLNPSPTGQVEAEAC